MVCIYTYIKGGGYKKIMMKKKNTYNENILLVLDFLFHWGELEIQQKKKTSY